MSAFADRHVPDIRSRSAAAEEPSIRMPVDIRSAALTVLAALAAILMLQYAQGVLVPIALGVLISYALDPVVAWLERRRIPRSLGAAVLLLALTVAGAATVYSLRFEAADIVQQLPQAARRLRQALESRPAPTADAIKKVQQAATELEKAAAAATSPPAAPNGVARVQVEPPPFDVSQYVVWGSVGIAAAVGQIVLVLFLVYFLLASGDLYRRKLVKIVGPSLEKKKITVEILHEIDRQIEYFLLVQVLTSTVVAMTTWLALKAIGMQQAGLWGLLAGVFNSIPYFGPILVSGGIASVAIMQFGTLKMAITAAAIALAITGLEGFLLTPWLTSRAARMNAVAVFVGLLFWGWVWNLWGMLLAVPLLVAIKAVCDHIDDFKGVGELLGE